MSKGFPKLVSSRFWIDSMTHVLTATANSEAARPSSKSADMTRSDKARQAGRPQAVYHLCPLMSFPPDPFVNNLHLQGQRIWLALDLKSEKNSVLKVL